MSKLIPVQPNFTKLLGLIVLATFSTATLAEHHATAEKTTEAMQKQQTIEAIQADNMLTEDEKTVMIKKEKRMHEMKKMMKENAVEEAPEE